MPDNTLTEEQATLYQQDAAYLYAEAAKERDAAGFLQPNWHTNWLAPQIQENAAHSSACARKLLGIV